MAQVTTRLLKGKSKAINPMKGSCGEGNCVGKTNEIVTKAISKGLTGNASSQQEESLSDEDDCDEVSSNNGEIHHSGKSIGADSAQITGAIVQKQSIVQQSKVGKKDGSKLQLRSGI